MSDPTISLRELREYAVTLRRDYPELSALTPGEKLKTALLLAYLHAELLKLRRRERELLLKFRDFEASLSPAEGAGSDE